jgi:NitT/TauT family transport system ATP-binding protein
MARHQITAGFLPLTDSAILIAAEAKGFAAAEDLDLRLVRETSWANIRDRIAVGHFEAAHMLAPMPIASNLGLTPLPVPLIAPMALGLGGNAVTVSNDLWKTMSGHGAGGIDPARNGAALKAAIAGFGEKKRQFAIVHPFSGHGYELRYWLAACGINPVTDIDIVIVPPSLMADALRNGRIDGFCAGEPWNSHAVAFGAGHIATVKSAIWKSSPEKVLGVSAEWAEANPQALDALLRSLHKASAWCSDPANLPELAHLLSTPERIGVDERVILKGLSGAIDSGHGVETLPDFFMTHARAATFPWESHALWFYSQMVRWGQVEHSTQHAAIARRSFRPDLYRRALKGTGAALPGANAKVEGALDKSSPVGAVQGTIVLGPDGFFDGRIFDPDLVDRYIADMKHLN